MSVLGKTRPDPIGIMLGTRFERFVSPIGIEGLARTNRSGRLDVLAVMKNHTNKRGLFKAFIKSAKLEYQTICVFAIENAYVHGALINDGFTPDVEIDEFGDTQEILRWDKPK